MRIDLVFMPGEGEQRERAMAFEMPGVPQVGDQVTIARPGQAGTAGFVVRRVRWALRHPEPASAQCGAAPVAGTTDSVVVECDFVPGPYSAEEHQPAASKA